MRDETRLYQHHNLMRGAVALLVGALAAWLLIAPASAAIQKIPDPPPAPGSYGLEATKKQPAPTTAPTITTPSSGNSFANSPITVGGLCNGDLLVQIYDNGVMVGAVECKGGSFQLQVSLFTGVNDLSAIQYDELEQASPESNHVLINFNNANFTAFGDLITLTSNYGRRAAAPGKTLVWPLLLSGGRAPYAFSIDWGDGTPAQLKSLSLAGALDIDHVYNQGGIYHVTIKVTDANGVSAFLQVVGVATGKPSATVGSTGSSGGGAIIITRIIWLPTLICLLLLLPAFWLGRRSELISLQRRLEKDLARYNEI
jgi:hypothetical protein